MKVIEAIGRGFNIAGRSLGILAVLFVFNVIWNLASIPFLGSAQPSVRQKVNPQLLGLTAIFILINIFIQGGLFGALKDAVISGRGAGLGNFAGYGKKFYLRFLGLGIFIMLGILFAILIIGLIFGISIVVKNIVVGIISVSVGIILTLIALYYLFMFFLSPYVLVVGDVGIFRAMGDSLRFVKNNFVKMAGLTTLLVLIGFGIGFIMGILTGVLSFVVKGTAFHIVTGVVTGAVNSYITVIISAALIVYYCGLSGLDKKKETEEISAPPA